MTEGTEAITSLHFAWMAALAVLVVIALIAGIRAKRRRVEAQREVQAHAEEAGVEPAIPFGDEPPQSQLPVSPPPAPDEVPAAIAEPPPASDQPSPADAPVNLLKGLGPKVATRLAELGIHRVGQIAALDPAQATALDAQLGPFAGRMERDRWIEQAQLLAAGDRDGFERVFGKL